MAQHIAICVAVFNSDYKSAYIFDILFVISTKFLKYIEDMGYMLKDRILFHLGILKLTFSFVATPLVTILVSGITQ